MADEQENAGQPLAQEDIEALLGGRKKPAAAPPPSTPPRAQSQDLGMAQEDLDLLLRQAEAALASIDQPAETKLPDGVTPFRLDAFTGAPASAEVATLELIRDVELDLRIELGRTHMYLEDVLKLRKGSVVPLDKLAGDPVDIFVNGRLIARGEVLVMNDNFCVRVAELITGERAAG
jgi:flagellar motor switch protein FliN/FliY